MDTNYGDRLNEAVAAEIRAERGRQKMTIAQLVSATGISKSKMLKLVHAKTAIDMLDIALLGQALGIEPIDLVLRAQASLAEEKEAG